MTAKDMISRTLWHLHCGVITQADAEAIIFPIIDDLIADHKSPNENAPDDYLIMTVGKEHT